MARIHAVSIAMWSALAAVFVPAAIARNAHAQVAAKGRPNILFLFTDDQRFDGAGALGNPILKTPTLDSLARQGMVFRNCYGLGSNVPAVCLPSRNMLLSGRAYFRWEGPQAPADPPNFPVTLKQAGYATYHHGKKGNSALRIQEKFDTNKYVSDDADRESGEPGQTIVDDAIAYLKARHGHDDRPFFMYLAFGNPHDPRVAAKKYSDLYERDRIPLPKDYMPLHPFDNGEMLIRDELLAPWPRTEAEIRRHLHEYYAVISGLDYHLGRLLAALQELNLTENTIILFASDNGLAVGSHGLMGKQNLYEAGAKVPLVVSGPGIRKGQTDALVYLLDIFPTVCDLVDAPVPAGLDGRSLKPVIDGKAGGVRDTLFLAYGECQRAIRDDRWKLIRYPQIDKTQLFDLREDPYELRDRAADPDQTGRINRMMAELSKWQKQLGDKTPLSVDKPRPAAFNPPTGQKLDELLKRSKTK